VPDAFRLLVVEDSATFMTLVHDLLRDEEALTVAGEARSGEEALEVAPGLTPDAALVDLTLPGISGYETARRLRQLVPGLCVILMSAEDDPIFDEAAIASGAQGFIGKRALRAASLLRLVSSRSRVSQGGSGV
jgi:CheY-like chemotaxis protein